MAEAPATIKKAFEELKEVYGYRLELRFLNKRFCIFEANSKWDPKRKKPVKLTHYIGWITNSGIVVPSRPKQNEARLKELEFEYNKALKHKQEIEEKRRGTAEKSEGDLLSDEDIMLLKALSMNPRMQHSKIANITGINLHTIEYRIQRLERILGIKYTLELNMNNLGFSEYLILAKFISSKPDYSSLKEALSRNPRVQLALLTKGAYDLIIFYEVENNVTLSLDLDAIRSSNALKDIDSEWYVTPIATSYGFVPLRQEFFDTLKEKVWHRKKHGEKPGSNDLMYREYALLRELNNDSTASFASIDKKYNLPAGSAKRAYENLSSEESKNILIRPTLTMQNLSYRYNSIIIADITNKSKFMGSRDDHHRYIIGEPGRFVSRFSFICDMETPDGIMYVFPALKEDSMETVTKELSDTIKGVGIDSLITEKIIVGNLCYRRFDNLYSDQYLSLVKRKSIIPEKRIDYR